MKVIIVALLFVFFTSCSSGQEIQTNREDGDCTVFYDLREQKVEGYETTLLLQSNPFGFDYFRQELKKKLSSFGCSTVKEVDLNAQAEKDLPAIDSIRAKELKLLYASSGSRRSIRFPDRPVKDFPLNQSGVFFVGMYVYDWSLTESICLSPFYMAISLQPPFYANAIFHMRYYDAEDHLLTAGSVGMRLDYVSKILGWHSVDYMKVHAILWDTGECYFCPSRQ